MWSFTQQQPTRSRRGRRRPPTRQRVRGRRRGRRVTGPVAGDAVEDGGGVAHRPCDHVLGHATTPALADVGAEGHAPRAARARRLPLLAGLRIEPPPSPACGARRRATPPLLAAVEPPLDPPTMRSGFHGLRVGSNVSGFGRSATDPSSGDVRPRRTSRSRPRGSVLGERAVVRRDPRRWVAEGSCGPRRTAACPRAALPRSFRRQRHAPERAWCRTMRARRGPAPGRRSYNGMTTEFERRVEPLDRVDAGFEQLALGALPRTHQLRLRGRVELGEVDRRAHQDASIRSRPIKFAGPTTRRGPRPARGADGTWIGRPGPMRSPRRTRWIRSPSSAHT